MSSFLKTQRENMQLLVDATRKLHASEKKVEALMIELAEKNAQVVARDSELSTAQKQIQLLKTQLETMVRIAFNFKIET